MVKKSLMVAVGLVALALLGCQGEVSQECAAPGPLCETTEAESAEPCDESELNCRRVEIEHCGGPWVVYCRENGGSGGADGAGGEGGAGGAGGEGGAGASGGAGGAGGQAATCACAEGELCVQSYDGTCQGGEPRCIATPEGCTLADLVNEDGAIDCSQACTEAICGMNSSCTMPYTACGDQAATPETAGSVACYGI